MARPRLYAAGWRSASTIDVRGATSFVLWLCGCNLRCPFCHNWRIAEGDPALCRWVPVEEIVDAVRSARSLVDYVHVTGGEPLLQADALASLLTRVRDVGLKVSVNSNLTLPGELLKLVELLDHVATDLKVPSLMYGVAEWEHAYKGFLRSIRELSQRGVRLELRVPLARLPVDEYVRVVGDALSAMAPGYSGFTIVYNRVVGRPLVEPRSAEWCERFCLGEEEYGEYVRRVGEVVLALLRSRSQTGTGPPRPGRGPPGRVDSPGPRVYL